MWTLTAITSDGRNCLSLADIELVDIFGRQRMTLWPRPSHVYPNEVLIYHGYLGCSPLYPSVAISLRTLAAYRHIQAQCKTFCHLHDILYHVKHCLDKALDRTTPDWRLLNACPCCFYCLEGERLLAFDWLVTIDGNNSLKRWVSLTCSTNAREDSWQACSDYWINRITINKFQNDVRAQTSGTSNPARLDDWDDVNHEAQSSKFNCTDRWRNTGPEQCKRMFAVFEESGIFIAACQHRFVLLACDMV
ncbi:hypothetical protein C8R48DRAFT_749256 [Suillus tomentosus]|nr:hypothetical protein C8R48DRAFT_749256 [Suillus tomentosus]